MRDRVGCAANATTIDATMPPTHRPPGPTLGSTDFSGGQDTTTALRGSTCEMQLSPLAASLQSTSGGTLADAVSSSTYPLFAELPLLLTLAFRNLLSRHSLEFLAALRLRLR